MAFANSLDLRLNKDVSPVDAGIQLPNFTDSYKGRAPDLGAYEEGEDVPRYGPRNE